MNRRSLLLIAALAWCGCGGQAPQPPIALPDSVPETAPPLKESFNPQSLNEDLLLIQPTFPPPTPEEIEGRIDSPSTAADADTTPGSSHTLYRVQLMALRNEESAQQRRRELETLLQIPVRIDRQRGLFVVSAGAFSSAAEAEVLKQRIVDLNDEYADAYVRSETVSESATPSILLPETAADTLASDTAQTDTTAVEQPPVRLVPAFGWRVRLDKMQSYEQAENLKKTAMSRLRRNDIDVTFKTPFYNVEIGHFRTEAEAQETLERLKGRYPNALKVRGQILVPAED